MSEVEGQAVPEPTPPTYQPENDSGWWSGITEGVTNVASQAARHVSQVGEQVATAAKNSDSPGFAFDHDQLISIADKWRELANTFEFDKDTIKTLLSTKPPGNEYASGKNVESVHDFGKVMTGGLTVRANYCANQEDKFRRAAGEYQKAEEEASNRVANNYQGSI